MKNAYNKYLNDVKHDKNKYLNNASINDNVISILKHNSID